MEFFNYSKKLKAAAHQFMLRHRMTAKSAQMRESAILLQGAGLSVTENSNAVTEYCNANQSINQALNAKIVAGPLGFEPRVSGSAGRCNNPYYTTGPPCIA